MSLNHSFQIVLPERKLRREVVELSKQTGKPILKLSTKDYQEHGMGHWIKQFGSAGLVNIEVFNQLQHTITGWPGGKPHADDSTRPERAKPFPKRVIVFSPLPDDDVISMGGTIRRLIRQGNEVHVAYETSGNIAVNDEEVTRFMHFINGFNQLFVSGLDDFISERYKAVKHLIVDKQGGANEYQALLALKGLIRRGEARLACAYNGITSDHIHFLDLPFYENGRTEKLPMTERDVTPIRELIAAVRPHQIYFAADLTDPHSTVSVSVFTYCHKKN